ncbi:MAG: hypothetical protein WDW36_006202 [Sanguina aurantia]
MGGNVDRGGSREGKGKSLRTNKVENFKVIKKGTQTAVTQQSETSTAPEAASEGLHFAIDAGVQLLSRQFERDSLKVLQRAIDVGVGLLIAFTTDFEKGDLLMKLARENSGRVYAAVGLHTDNLKRNNDKLCAARLEMLRERALRPEAVAVMAGLDLSRDVALRYAQEKVLQQQMDTALEVGLPLLLYHVQAATELAEKISEFRESGVPGSAIASIAIFDFSGSDAELQAFLALGCFIALTGRICVAAKQPHGHGSGEGGQAPAPPSPDLSSIPLERLLVANNAPFHTPQSIDDAHMREGRNEPSNLPHVLGTLSQAHNTELQQLAGRVHANTLSFFKIPAHTSSCSAGATSQPPHAPPPSPPSQTPAQPGPSGSTPSCSSGATHTSGAHPALGSTQRPLTHDITEDMDRPHPSPYTPTGPGFSNLTNRVSSSSSSSSSTESEERTTASADVRALGPAVAGSGSTAASVPGSIDDVIAGPTPPARAPPRNFVAEHQASLAARGEVEGPRVVYTCRVCRAPLFSEHDLSASAGHGTSIGEQELVKAEFRSSGSTAAQSRNGRGRGERSGCSMHFLTAAPSWFDPTNREEDTQIGSSGPPTLSGKLSCPSCHVKLGKWAAPPLTTASSSSSSSQQPSAGGAPGAASQRSGGRSSSSNSSSRADVDGGGVQCSCGLVVPAPAFAILRARLDIVDSQMDIATAINSSLQLYDAEADAGSGSSSDSGGEGVGKAGRKSRTHKVKASNTSNFSSFRNKRQLNVAGS